MSDYSSKEIIKARRKRYNPDRKWLSLPLLQSDPTKEVLTYGFSSPTSVNNFSFWVKDNPTLITFFYLDDYNIEKPLLDKEGNPLYLSRNNDKDFTEDSDEFKKCEIDFKKTKLGALIIKMSRMKTETDFFSVLGLKEFTPRLRIRDKEDLADLPDTIDEVGNIISYEWDFNSPEKAHDNDDTTFWMSSPQPKPDAVVCRYFDVSQNGNSVFLDGFFLDPVFHNVNLNVYYSNDDNEETGNLSYKQIPATGQYYWHDGILLSKEETDHYDFSQIKNLSGDKAIYLEWEPDFPSTNAVATPLTIFTDHENYSIEYTQSGRLVFYYLKDNGVTQSITLNGVVFDGLDKVRIVAVKSDNEISLHVRCGNRNPISNVKTRTDNVIEDPSFEESDFEGFLASNQARTGKLSLLAKGSYETSETGEKTAVLYDNATYSNTNPFIAKFGIWVKTSSEYVKENDRLELKVGANTTTINFDRLSSFSESSRQLCVNPTLKTQKTDYIVGTLAPDVRTPSKNTQATYLDGDNFFENSSGELPAYIDGTDQNKVFTCSFWQSHNAPEAIRDTVPVLRFGDEEVEPNTGVITQSIRIDGKLWNKITYNIYLAKPYSEKGEFFLRTRNFVIHEVEIPTNNLVCDISLIENSFTEDTVSGWEYVEIESPVMTAGIYPVSLKLISDHTYGDIFFDDVDLEFGSPEFYFRNNIDTEMYRDMSFEYCQGKITFFAIKTDHFSYEKFLDNPVLFLENNTDNMICGGNFREKELLYGALDENGYEKKTWIPITDSFVTRKDWFMFGSNILTKYIKFEYYNLAERGYNKQQFSANKKYKTFPNDIIDLSTSVAKDVTQIDTSINYLTASRFTQDVTELVHPYVGNESRLTIENALLKTDSKNYAQQLTWPTEDQGVGQPTPNKSTEKVNEAYFDFSNSDPDLTRLTLDSYDFDMRDRINSNTVIFRDSKPAQAASSFRELPSGTIVNNDDLVAVTSEPTNERVSPYGSGVLVNTKNGIQYTNSGIKKFIDTRVHKYQNVEYENNSDVAYFAGEKELKFRKVNYEQMHDTKCYDFVRLDEWFNMTNLVTNDKGLTYIEYPTGVTDGTGVAQTPVFKSKSSFKLIKTVTNQKEGSLNQVASLLDGLVPWDWSPTAEISPLSCTWGDPVFEWGSTYSTWGALGKEGILNGIDSEYGYFSNQNQLAKHITSETGGNSQVIATAHLGQTQKRFSIQIEYMMAAKFDGKITLRYLNPYFETNKDENALTNPRFIFEQDLPVGAVYERKTLKTPSIKTSGDVEIQITFSDYSYPLDMYVFKLDSIFGSTSIYARNEPGSIWYDITDSVCYNKMENKTYEFPSFGTNLEYRIEIEDKLDWIKGLQGYPFYIPVPDMLQVRAPNIIDVNPTTPPQFRGLQNFMVNVTFDQQMSMSTGNIGIVDDNGIIVWIVTTWINSTTAQCQVLKRFLHPGTYAYTFQNFYNQLAMKPKSVEGKYVIDIIDSSVLNITPKSTIDSNDNIIPIEIDDLEEIEITFAQTINTTRAANKVRILDTNYNTLIEFQHSELEYSADKRTVKIHPDLSLFDTFRAGRTFYYYVDFETENFGGLEIEGIMDEKFFFQLAPLRITDITPVQTEISAPPNTETITVTFNRKISSTPDFFIEFYDSSSYEVLSLVKTKPDITISADGKSITFTAPLVTKNGLCYPVFVNFQDMFSELLTNTRDVDWWWNYSYLPPIVTHFTPRGNVNEFVEWITITFDQDIIPDIVAPDPDNPGTLNYVKIMDEYGYSYSDQSQWVWEDSRTLRIPGIPSILKKNFEVANFKSANGTQTVEYFAWIQQDLLTVYTEQQNGVPSSTQEFTFTFSEEMRVDMGEIFFGRCLTLMGMSSLQISNYFLFPK